MLVMVLEVVVMGSNLMVTVKVMVVVVLSILWCYCSDGWCLKLKLVGFFIHALSFLNYVCA